MPRSITSEDLYRIKFVSRPRISPDGQHIACVVTTINERTYEYHSAIWLVPTSGGEPRRFTTGQANAHSPCWSPDGRWIAFVSNRASEQDNYTGDKEKQQQEKGMGQIWLIPTVGGEAQQLTFMPFGASHPTWSPDSRQLLFRAAVGAQDEELVDGKPLPKVRVIDRLWYRLDGVGYIYERRQHLFLIDVNGGEPQQLTDGDWDDNDPAWSPDGTRMAFTSNRAQDRWQFNCPDLYILPMQHGQGGVLQRLTRGNLACQAPSWSPDGQTIAFFASTKVRAGGHIDMYTLPSDAVDQDPQCLTAEFEGSFADWTNTDMSDEHILPPPVWSPDGSLLYAMAVQRGTTRVYGIPRGGAGKQPLILTPGNVHVLDFSVDKEMRKITALMEDATHVAEAYVCSITTPGEVRRLTSFNDELLAELQLSTPEHMTYRGAEDWPIDGWILKPPDFDASKRYPLILEIHGGPNTQYGYGFMHEMQMLAGAGYVVLFTNPRGSLGYGREFSLAVRGEWGIKDSLDILAGVDEVIQKGYVDGQRLGVVGGSYGGFMTNWLIGHTDRFKAAITDRSVVNRASFFGTSDIGWDFTDDDLEVTPWDDPELYRRMSPISYVKQMHTPLLIIHSEQDLRCGIEQAEELFAALKYLGREVKFIRFEGQSHGLSRGGHPKLRVERLRHIAHWFDQHLKAE